MRKSVRPKVARCRTLGQALGGQKLRERGSRQIPRDPDAVETFRFRLARSCDPGTILGEGGSG